jgi:aryl-alcohol dehydrogenase-like predicted oxidoreductase
MKIQNITPYTFGCMSLGLEVEQGRILEDVAVAREAMDAGIWFHCSPTYSRGFSFMILRMAFDQDRSKVPPLIVKVRDRSPEFMRFEVEDSCRRLGVDSINIAQLVSMDREPGNLMSQLKNGGPIADELASLRKRGLIQQAVLFVDKENSDAGVSAVQSSPLVEGLTCYWNATQRELSDAAWKSVLAEEIPVIAIRTLAGAKETPNHPGCEDAVEFALRLRASYPVVQTSIGGTRNPEHLRRFLECAEKATPLPQEILTQIPV